MKRRRLPLMQAAHDGGYTVNGELDVCIGGPPAKSEPDRRARSVANGADRGQHVRRSLAARTARGSRRHREIAERHQQRFTLDTGETDVKVVRQAARQRAVDADVVEILANAG